MVSTCAPPAVPSAAMSSGEGPVRCPPLPGQTGGHCQGSLPGLSCRRQVDTSNKGLVTTSTLKHSLDSCGKTEVPHIMSCTCTKNVAVLILAYRTEPRAGAAKFWAFKPSLTQEVPAKRALLRGLSIVTVLLK